MGFGGGAGQAWEVDRREEMVRDHLPRLLRLCAVIVGDHQEAEDLVQEVFLKALGAVRWFRGQSSLSTWLTRIAINTCKDRLREKRRGREILEAEVPEGPDPAPSAADRAVLSQMVARALAPLSPKEEAVVRLRFGGDYQLREIADTLRCSESTAKTHLKRGLQKMAKALEGMDR